jgi:hypothetical protein
MPDAWYLMSFTVNLWTFKPPHIVISCPVDVKNIKNQAQIQVNSKGSRAKDIARSGFREKLGPFKRGGEKGRRKVQGARHTMSSIFLSFSLKPCAVRLEPPDQLILGFE